MNFYDFNDSLNDPFDLYGEEKFPLLSTQSNSNFFSKEWGTLCPFEKDENLFSGPSETEEIVPDGILYLDTQDKFEHDGVLYLTDDRPYVSSDSHLSPHHYDSCQSFVDRPFVAADSHTEINYYLPTLSDSEIDSCESLLDNPFITNDSHTDNNFSTHLPITSDSEIDYEAPYQSPVPHSTFYPNCDSWSSETKLNNFSTHVPITSDSEIDYEAPNRFPVPHSTFYPNYTSWPSETKLSNLSVTDLLKVNPLSNNPYLYPNNPSLWKSELSWMTEDQTKNKKPKMSSFLKTGDDVEGFANRSDYFRSPLREQQLQRYRQKKLRRVYQRSVDEKRSTQAKNRGRNSRGRFVAEANSSLCRGIKDH